MTARRESMLLQPLACAHGAAGMLADLPRVSGLSKQVQWLESGMAAL